VTYVEKRTQIVKEKEGLLEGNEAGKQAYCPPVNFYERMSIKELAVALRPKEPSNRYPTLT